MAQNTSAKILSIVKSGHYVEMWHCDDEEQRERQKEQGISPVKIRLSANDDGLAGTCKCERIRDGEVVNTKTAGQPHIYNLTKNRSWSVNKQ